ncbi:MAG: glycosyltransferase [Candidatus Odinarchaeota archaeon]
MKICFLITGMGVGGAEKHILKLIPLLKCEKFIISLTNFNEFGKILTKHGVKIYYLGFKRYNFFSVINQFRIIILKEKPNIIDSYLIHSNLFARIFGKLFGINKIINSVRNDYSSFKFLSFLDRITQNKVDLYLINSYSLFSYVNRILRVPISKIKVLPNGIDLENIYRNLDYEFNIKSELCLKEETIIIVSISRLHKQKNLPILIKTLQYLDDNFILIIVGDGPERIRLIKLTKELKLNHRVHFLGIRFDIVNILNSSDIFILPSKIEGMSNALLEAMALKKICIVSKIPQNEVLIKDGINGFLFNPTDENDLAKKIQTVHNNNALDKIQQAALTTVETDHLINNIAIKYEEIVERLLDF